MLETCDMVHISTSSRGRRLDQCGLKCFCFVEIVSVEMSFIPSFCNPILGCVWYLCSLPR